MRIRDLQEDVRAFCVEKGFTQVDTDMRMVYLTSEIGEIAKEVIRHRWAKSEEERAAIRRNLGHEIYDAVWNLLELANKMDIDLEQAFAEKMAINRERTW